MLIALKMVYIFSRNMFVLENFKYLLFSNLKVSKRNDTLKVISDLWFIPMTFAEI